MLWMRALLPIWNIFVALMLHRDCTDRDLPKCQTKKILAALEVWENIISHKKLWSLFTLLRISLALKLHYDCTGRDLPMCQTKKILWLHLKGMWENIISWLKLWRLFILCTYMHRSLSPKLATMGLSELANLHHNYEEAPYLISTVYNMCACDSVCINCQR